MCESGWTAEAMVAAKRPGATMLVLKRNDSWFLFMVLKTFLRISKTMTRQ